MGVLGAAMLHDEPHSARVNRLLDNLVAPVELAGAEAMGQG